MGFEILNGINDHYYFKEVALYKSEILHIDSVGFLDELLTADYYQDHHYRVVSYSVGLSPIVGFNVDINKRWSFACLMIYDLYFNIPFQQRIFNGNKNIGNHKGFNLFGEAPFADVSLTYSFGKNNRKKE